MVEMALVSAACAAPEGPFGERARRVLALVDRVHRVSPLPSIPIDHQVENLFADGQYRFDRHRGKARGIGIRASAPHPELTLLHEIGHFLDHQALGRPGSFASKLHPDLPSWRRVVWASTAFQEAHAARVAAELRGVRVDHFDYWLATTELWSRAYAQYIVSVTRDVGLRVQLDEVWGSGVVYHWVYWEERDFARILEAVDRLFRQKEWR